MTRPFTGIQVSSCRTAPSAKQGTAGQYRAGGMVTTKPYSAFAFVFRSLSFVHAIHNEQSG